MADTPGFLPDGRPLYLIAEQAGGRFSIIGPHMAITGFESADAASHWLPEFFDMNARRAADLEMEREYDAERLKIEREEMFLRLLEPKRPQ